MECLKRMLAHIQHRGPDEMGYYFDDTVAIGAARLSIVDVEAGQQPFGDTLGRYWIAFNGEIYNYRELREELIDLGFGFTSASDTEVLLNAWIAWGTRALERLNGPFAFCIFDRTSRTLALARDRFGKRPLYYLHDGQGLVFGSEMKCFLGLEGFRFAFDEEQLASLFRIWTPLDDRAPYRGIHQVPAGSCLMVGPDSLATVRYATLDLNCPAAEVSEAEAAECVREVLFRSVARRVSGQAEVGTYLSGGIDSAIVSLLATQSAANTRLKSFSIAFEDEEFDESADQRLLASFLHSEHYTLRVTARDIVDAFESALWHAEVPVFRTAFVPMFLLSKVVRESGLKVVLSGEGADEAFLGYDIFKETALRQAWKQSDAATNHMRLSRMYSYLSGFRSYDPAAVAALFERFARKEMTPFFSHEIRFHNSNLAGRLLGYACDPLRPLRMHLEAASREVESLSSLQRAQWLECKTLLGGYLLSTQGDRMSMAHGVESRCPFLDPEVMRVACATNLRFGDVYEEKPLLKKAFEKVLPERILRKRKQPYRAPDASAFVRCRPEYLERLCSEHELKKVGVLNTKVCQSFVNRILSTPPESISQAENQALLFLLSVTVLHAQFVERGRGPPPDIDALLTKRIQGSPCE